MAQNAPNDINYFLVIHESKKEDLASVRPWSNLKIAFEEKFIWVKDFDFAQINSLEVKCIPYKTIYYSKQGKLYLLNSLLPDRNIPNLLWTNIDRAITIKLPSFNHNYFGLNENIATRIVACEYEHEAEIMITSITSLQQYIETAPAIRLQKLKWVILNNDKVLIIGKPMLPINGNVYWKKDNAILPTGFNFEFPLLTDVIHSTINPENQFLVIWNTDNTYALIDKDEFEPLSLSSFRLSVNKHPLHI